MLGLWGLRFLGLGFLLGGFRYCFWGLGFRADGLVLGDDSYCQTSSRLTD